MDENKRKKLIGIGYEIVRSCGNCRHSTFPQNDWGTCGAHQYYHLKHSDSKRQLSIHRSGCCDSHEWVPIVTGWLGKYDEFRRDR